MVADQAGVGEVVDVWVFVRKVFSDGSPGLFAGGRVGLKELGPGGVAALDCGGGGAGEVGARAEEVAEEQAQDQRGGDDCVRG